MIAPTVMEAATASKLLEQAVERLTGDPIATVRARTLEETRDLAEKRHRKPFRFVSRFPFIGRGNVLRDCIVTHEQVEASLDRALRDAR